MYNLKPILVDQNIDLPPCMYKLKPVNNENSGNMQESINNSSKSEVELLEEKQNRILQKLEELKHTLISMRGDLKLCNKPPQPQQKVSTTGSNVVKKPINIEHLGEIVINVHPCNAPFSILALKNLWKGRLNLQANVYTHSTVKESDFSKLAKDFSEKVSAPVESNNLPTLKIVIIWKDVDTTQMQTSPVNVPVYGEVNIVRYLNRVGPSEFWYETENHFAALNDNILDICYQLSKKLSVKERQALVSVLSQKLGKGQFYNESSSLSVADVAVSSTLKKVFLNNPKEMPANLTSYLKNVSSIAGY